MKNWVVATSAALLLLAGGVQAHTHLDKAVPAANAVVKTAPKEIQLQFSEVTRLVALTLQQEGGKEISLQPLPTAAAKTMAVPVSALTPGKYLVKWRVVGDDSHVVSGKFSFTLSAE